MSVKANETTVTILSSDGVNAFINLVTALPGVLISWVIWTTCLMWVLFALVNQIKDWPGKVVAGINKLFWVIDVVFNLLTGSIWFLELPKAPWYIETFSDRLRRHYRHEARGWRKNLAALFRGPINAVDEGHI